jgi:hypothetical protein
VRLVKPQQEEERESRVPVPWAPAPNRPKRTPPPKAPDTGEQTSPPEQNTSDEQPQAERSRPQVDLTPEELAALLGRRVEDEPPEAREQQR